MKTAVIYWSGTGNTEQMATAVAEGAGAELIRVSDFSGDIAEYDRLAFGCSAMGDEVLEEEEFEPFFAAIEGALRGKNVALFGSYGWGDGEWMRNWEDSSLLFIVLVSNTAIPYRKIYFRINRTVRMYISGFTSFPLPQIRCSRV